MTTGMSTLRRYLLPGLVFQSVVIGGGYATGRELIEFFMPSGPLGGLLGMGVTMLVWGGVTAVSLELARQTQSYDYKSFFSQLLGRGWVLFEIGYVLLLVLVLSVLGAASGELAYEGLGWPRAGGAIALMLAVAAVLFAGSRSVERVLAALGLSLYAVYLVLFCWVLAVFGDSIGERLASVPVQPGWAVDGLRYAGYNMAVMTAVLFCARGLTSRRQALWSGLLCGPVAMLPGVLFFLAMVAFYPEIGEQALPSAFLLRQIDAGAFAALFQWVVFGTLVATGAGLLHAINERASGFCAARGLVFSPAARVTLPLGLMLFSVFLAGSVGLVGLIGRGYGLLTWLFIAVIVVPVLTVGVCRIIGFRGPGPAPTASSVADRRM
jgi:uncharacterized membrane protein YkvI